MSTPRVWLKDAKTCANSMAECLAEGRIEAAIHRAETFLETARSDYIAIRRREEEQYQRNLVREGKLAKIAAIVESAQDRNPAYLDAAEMLGIYLLATSGGSSTPQGAT